MFTMFALARMVIRAGVLAALVATVMSVAAAVTADGEWETVEAHAEDALDWLADLIARLGGVDPSVGDITLSDLTSPSGWADLGSGLFGGGEQPGEIDPAIADVITDRIDADHMIDQALDQVSTDNLTDAVDTAGLDLGGIDIGAVDPTSLLGGE